MNFDEVKSMVLEDWNDGGFVVAQKAADKIDELRETYAKPVEMTQAQYDQFILFREYSWFSVFMNKQGAREVPAFSEFISKERERELMRAWLDTDLIKVVDE